MFQTIIKPKEENLTIHIPKQYLNKKLRITLIPIEEENWDYWKESEIDKIGNIGFISSSFEEDEEDYSKW